MKLLFHYFKKPFSFKFIITQNARLGQMFFKYLWKCSKETFKHFIIKGCFIVEENFPVRCTKKLGEKIPEKIFVILYFNL